MNQIANAIFFLHDMKMANCDLKPQNIVIINFEMEKIKKWLHTCELIDFGISKVKVNGDKRPINQS